jgi:sugar/nucleoside kinase (ribokinase family)
MINYVVHSNIIVDDIVLATGEERTGILGGAATYAAAGLRLWDERVGLVSGVGADFTAGSQPWFERNGFDLRGVTVRGPHTPRSWVRYHANGERDEAPQFGDEHFASMESLASDLPGAYRTARGLYIFRSHAPAFWHSLRLLPGRPAHTILWEIAANAALPGLRAQVAANLQLVDILSINRTEALRLYQASNVEDAMRAASADGARVVVLRMGSEGSMACSGARMLQIPAARAKVVDVTGGGNAFSGGFLAGYCQSGGDLETAGRYAAVAAAFAIEQYGPPALIDVEAQATARTRAAALRIMALPVTGRS